MSGLDTDRSIPQGLAEAKKDEAELDAKLAHSDADSYMADGVHDGLEFPTEEERHNLRRVADAIPWNSYSECCPSFPDFRPSRPVRDPALPYLPRHVLIRR